MAVTVTGIEWDEGNRLKCQKHGLSTDDVEHALMEGIDFIFRGHRNSITEGRYIAVGKVKNGRPAFVALTLRIAESGSLLLRPVSARYMHEKESRKYEKIVPKNTRFQK